MFSLVVNGGDPFELFGGELEGGDPFELFGGEEDCDPFELFPGTFAGSELRDPSPSTVSDVCILGNGFKLVQCCSFSHFFLEIGLARIGTGLAVSG